MGRIKQHHSDDISRIAVGIQPYDQTAKRLTD
jgi:hypothetical protein